MHDNVTEVKMEKEMENVCRLLDVLERRACIELEGDLERVDTHEMGETIDMIKDLYEAKEKIAKACYYKSITKAMEEESGKGQDRMYFPVPDMRDMVGRMDGTSGSESWRDGGSREGERRGRDGRYDSMGGDRVGRQDGRSGSSRSGVKGTGGRYGFSFDEYMETREMYPGQEQEHKRMRAEALNRELDELVDMGKEVVQDMSPEEKQIWKGKISKILNM